MKSAVKITREENLFTSDQKIKHFGYGEWINEFDILEFEYKLFRCKVLRICVIEPYAVKESYFGGHLCGYVNVPNDHPYLNKDYGDIDIDCHGGLTYGQNLSDGYWIGFDCAHGNDIVPSSEFMMKDNPKYKLWKKDFPITEDLSFYNPTYKNMDFCIDNCCQIVKQLITIMEKESV